MANRTDTMLKPLGNTVLIEPLADPDFQVSAGGIVLVNKYKKSNLKFRVLAVGNGEQRKRKLRSGRLKTTAVFDKPEVEVGDCILCRADLDDGVTKHTFDDGTGRLIIHAWGIMAKWRE